MVWGYKKNKQTKHIHIYIFKVKINQAHISDFQRDINKYEQKCLLCSFQSLSNDTWNIFREQNAKRYRQDILKDSDFRKPTLKGKYPCAKFNMVLVSRARLQIIMIICSAREYKKLDSFFFFFSLAKLNRQKRQ